MEEKKSIENYILYSLLSFTTESLQAPILFFAASLICKDS